MYIKNNIVYADAGKILRTPLAIGYALEVDVSTIEELTIELEDMQINGDFIIYFNGLITQGYKKLDYAEWKATIVKWRYSIDDQMAIVLNKDVNQEKLVDYQRMQDWREWASILAKKIISVDT